LVAERRLRDHVVRHLGGSCGIADEPYDSPLPHPIEFVGRKLGRSRTSAASFSH
jgi:hypothetical protein